MTDRDIAVETIGLGKSYGKVLALTSVDLRIKSGQYFVLLGPSGGGKTTLLRLVGGFIRPSSGRVLLHGIDMSEVPPNHRRTSMVFQSFALFPHMTVERNIGYGLRLRKLCRRDGCSCLHRIGGTASGQQEHRRQERKHAYPNCRRPCPSSGHHDSP